MSQRFETMRLPGQPDALAPDGSNVRVLLRLGGGSMAHFELAAGRTSRAVAHRTVDEIWHVHSGKGEMWRRQDDQEQTVPWNPAPACRFPPAPASSSGPRARAHSPR